MLSHIIGPVNEDWLTSSENKIEQRSETHLIIKEGFPMKAVGRSDIVKRFLASERTGFDFAVLQEGEIGVGESIELVAKNQSSVRVGDITGSLRARSTTSSCSAGQLKSRLCPQLEEPFFRSDSRNSSVSPSCSTLFAAEDAGRVTGQSLVLSGGQRQ